MSLAWNFFPSFTFYHTNKIDDKAITMGTTRRRTLRRLLLQRYDDDSPTMFGLVAGFLVSATLLSQGAEGVYISYEKARSYAEGDRIPIQANKLTSSDALAAMDYSHLPICGNQPQIPAATKSTDGMSAWQRAVTSLHGDAFYDVGLVLNVAMKQDAYCRQLCIADLADLPYESAIAQDMHYNFWIDGMPTAFRQETDQRVSIRYWGGIPVGRRGNTADDAASGDADPRFSQSSQQDLFVYNHFNVYLTYWKLPTAEDQYRVVRAEIQPFSIAYDFDQSATVVPTDLYGSTSPSCLRHAVPTTYSSLNETAPQLLPFRRNVLFTYDVVWREFVSESDPWNTRWNVFLRMDDGIPLEVQLFGLLVAILINVILFVSLWTWLMRDLSYKPLLSMGIVTEGDSDEVDVPDGQVEEMKLWPLSTRLYFPPRVAPLWFCICSGTGAQLAVSSFLFVLLFRSGVISESLGANILTPAVVLYALSSVVGGWVTARFYGLFHGNRIQALQACLAVATLFPLLGLLVIYLTYDVLRPETAPDYKVVSASLPIILVWLLVVFPLTFLGGCLGYRKGPMHNFPVSEGSKGYQDLALQDNNEYIDENPRQSCCCWKHSRVFFVFLIAGLAPVACSFVEYAYSVAGSVCVGYFSDSSFFALFSYFFYCTCVALVGALLFYQQVRFQNYEWWWNAFVAGASSGFYLFLLSMSWILYDASSGTIARQAMASYTLWFAFGSLGAAFVAGFVSVAGCMLLMRLLYAFLQSRASPDGPVEETELVVESPAPQRRATEETRASRSYNLQSIMEYN